MAFDLEFRDDNELTEAPPEVEPPQQAPQQDTHVADTLSQSVTPQTTPEQAAATVSTMSPADQRSALLWLNTHRGGLFAQAVAANLEGSGDSTQVQLEGLGDSVAQAVGQQSLVNFGVGEQGLSETEDTKYGGKEILASYSDPLLGQFQVLFDVEVGVSSFLKDGVVTIASTSGLTLKTPEGLSDLTINYIKLDLKTGEVTITSTPPVGKFEEQLISSGLKSSLLAGLDQLDSQADLAETLGLEVDSDGMIALHESTMVDVYLDSNASITASLTNRGVLLFFSRPIFCDILGPVNLSIQALEYDFSSAEVDLIPAGEGNAVSRVLEEWASSLGESFANDLVQGMLPDGMKEAGYDPKTDPNLTENFRALMQNLGSNKAENSAENQSLEPSQSEASQGPMSEQPEGDFLPIYVIETSAGTMTLAIDNDDTLDLTKSATHLTLGASKGLHMIAPGSSWIEGLRLFEIRYGLADGEIEIDASEPVGEITTDVLESLIRSQILPRMPGEVLGRIGVGQDPLHLPEGGELNVLYATEAPGIGQVHLLADETDDVKISRGGTRLTIESQTGVHIRALGAQWIPELIIGRLEYDLESGEIAIDPPAQQETPLDVGPLTETLVKAIVLTQLLPLLPGSVADSAGLQRNETSPELPEANGNVILTDTWGPLGEVDVSLVPGDSIGFSHTPGGVGANIQQGLLIRAPDVGFSVQVFELNYNSESGESQVRSAPELGSYEEAVLAGAIGEFLMPQLQLWMTDQDSPEGLNVLYRFEMGGVGEVRVCVESGDSITVQEDASSLTVTSGSGLFMLQEEESMDSPSVNRIKSVRLDLGTGALDIQADRDIGELGELVAERLIQSMVLPRLSPELRAKLFGGQDPLQESSPALPEVGQLLHAGEVKGMAFDLSVEGDRFSVNSLAGGQLMLAAPAGVLLRVPDLGLAVSLFGLTYDPSAGRLTQVHTEPQMGPGEAALLEDVIATFAEAGGFLAAAQDPALDGLRTVAQLGGTVLKVESDDDLVVRHGAGHTVVHASRGIVIESAFLRDAPPRLSAIRYEHGTGEIRMDLVDTVDDTVYKDEREVSGLTQEALSALVRRLIDPHLTDEMRGLGFVGEEASTTLPHEPSEGETTWLEKDAGPLGRVMLFSKVNDSISITANNEEYAVNAPMGIRLVLPDLGVEHTVYRLLYHLETDDVHVTGMGRLETEILRSAARSLVEPIFASKGLELQEDRGAVAQLRDASPKSDEGATVLTQDKATLHIPSDCEMVAEITGQGLNVVFDPKIWIDGPGVGNFYLERITYDFGTATADVDVDGSNLLSAIFEGVGESRATQALTKLMHERLPEAMQVPGYNLFTDPNKQQNLEELFSNFSKGGPERSE